MGATGQVYRIVGMEMVRSDDPEMADAREVTTE
jgi:hypothetical protein